MGLRLVPDREVDDVADGSGEAAQPTEPRAEPDDDQAPGDQPPALGATPAATPSR